MKCTPSLLYALLCLTFLVCHSTCNGQNVVSGMGTECPEPTQQMFLYQHLNASIWKGTLSFEEREGNFNISDDISTEQLLPVSTLLDDESQQLLLFCEREPCNKETASLVLSLTTSDCNATTIQVEYIAHGFNRLFLRLDAGPDEAVYGGGEQFTYFNMRGHKFPIWTQEQGVGRNKSDELTRIMDAAGGRGGDYHTTYFPQATFFSTSNYYLHVNTYEYSELNFESDAFHEVKICGQDLVGTTLRFVRGESLVDLVQDFSSFAGRPNITKIPEWTNTGMIVGLQGGTQRMKEKCEQLLEAGVKIAGIWIQDWVGRVDTSFGQRLFWDWKLNQTLYPNLKEEIAELKSRGIRVLGYVNPYLSVDGELFKEGAEKGFLVLDTKQQPLRQDFGGFSAGSVDLTNVAAVNWFKQIIKSNMIDLGFSGWMADFGEYLPVEELSLDLPQSSHNEWPVLWAKLNHDAVKEAGCEDEIIFWTRSGNFGSSSYSLLTWAGDQLVDFSRSDGLPSLIPAALSLGFSGIGLTHHDIGGYTSVLNVTRSRELLLRSAELALFSPLFRTHESNRPALNVQVYDDEEFMAAFARLSTIYSFISANYTKHAVDEFLMTGLPVWRPLSLHYHDDRQTWDIQDQFLVGRDLLVAPVLSEGQDSRSVYLPADEWVYVWNGTSFTGPATVIIESPLGRPAAFYRSFI